MHTYFNIATSGGFGWEFFMRVFCLSFILIFCICMYVWYMHVWICLCKHVGTRVCICVHMHIEDHGWCQIFLDYSLPDILKHWTQNLPIFLTQLATLPWGYAVSFSSSQLLRSQAGCNIWLLYGCRCGGSKLGPYTYVLSTVSAISPALLCTDLSWHAGGTLTRTQLSTEWFWFVKSNYT